MGTNLEQEKVSIIKSEEKLKPISAMIKKSDNEEIPTIVINPENQQQKQQPPPQMYSEPELTTETNIISPQNIIQTQTVHSEVCCHKSFSNFEFLIFF